MAQPIPFHAPPPDPRALLRERLERAPEEHAEAVLAAYDLLQQLHDRGVLDVTRSALTASDELLEKVVEGVNTPGAIRALRNLLFWQGILGSIEPKWFKGLTQAIPEGLATATAERDEPVRVWKLLRRALSKDSLRGLAAAVDFLESFGRHLHALEASEPVAPPPNEDARHRR
jgi:uncharacterized protein YjgD (DUF1641 family)